jgi:hypothetical protein
MKYWCTEAENSLCGDFGWLSSWTGTGYTTTSCQPVSSASSRVAAAW